MKTILLTGLLAFLCISSQGQKTYSLSGSVYDSVSKEKLVNASAWINPDGADSLLQWNAATDSKGNFKFFNLPYGDYILQVSHTGFIPVAKKILITKDDNISIGLLKANTRLANVTILSEKKSLVTHTTDKITYNVSEGAVTASDNLYNIILKVTGVVESNGSLFYQGKPLIILFDNKSNNLSGDDLQNYLAGILGTNIDKLEVLLNPSSRYDAQGGAVFNIRSKKNKNYGLSKSITAGAGSGTYRRHPLGFALNYRNDKINIYGGYDYNYQKQFFLLKAFLGFTANPSTIYLVDDNTRTHNNHSVRFGLDYDLNKNTSLGLLFRGFQNYRTRAVVNNSVFSPGNNNNMDTIVDVITNTKAVFKSPSVNFFLKKKISSKGADLTVNADYFAYHKKWDEDIRSTFADEKGNSTASPEYLVNKSPADNSVKSIAADLFLPVKNGNIETGLKATESKTDNDVLWQLLDNTRWKTDSGKTNHFIYKEDVYASYISMLKKYKKLTLQAGLRIEVTRSNGISVTTNTTTVNKYTDLFPSISFQYNPAADQQFSINYRRSIKRFGFDIINPFVITQGPYSYHQGNPYIKPSYFSSISVSWSYKNKLVAGAGFSFVKNPMSYGYRKYGNNNASIGSFLNFSAGKLYSSNISYTEKFFKGKWTSINSITFLHSEFPDFDSYIQHYNSYTLNTINTITLPAKIVMELSAFYNSQILNGTVLQGAYYGTSIGFSKPVLKSKGSLKISCVDLFNTQIFHNRTNGAGININAYWKPESRFANVLFTYRFGNLNVKANKNRNTGIEEEKSRMGNN